MPTICRRHMASFDGYLILLRTAKRVFVDLKKSGDLVEKAEIKVESRWAHVPPCLLETFSLAA